MREQEINNAVRSYTVLTRFDAAENEYVSMTREFGEAVIGYSETASESLIMLYDNLADMVRFYADKGLALPTPMPV